MSISAEHVNKNFKNIYIQNSVNIYNPPDKYYLLFQFDVLKLNLNE